MRTLTTILTAAATVAALAMPAGAAEPTVHVGTAVTPPTAATATPDPWPTDSPADTAAAPGHDPTDLTGRWVSLASATAAAFTGSGRPDLEASFLSRADRLFATDTATRDLSTLDIGSLVDLDARTADLRELMDSGTGTMADLAGQFTQAASIDSAAVAAGIDWAQSRSSLTVPALQLPDASAAPAQFATAAADQVGFGVLLRESMATFAQANPASYAQVAAGTLGDPSLQADWSAAVATAGARIGGDLADRMPAPGLAAFTLAMASGDPDAVADRLGTTGYDPDCVTAGLFMHTDLLRLGGPTANDVQRAPGTDELVNPAGEMWLLPRQQEWAEQLGLANTTTQADAVARDQAGADSLAQCTGADRMPDAVGQMMDSAFADLGR